MTTGRDCGERRFLNITIETSAYTEHRGGKDRDAPWVHVAKYSTRCES